MTLLGVAFLLILAVQYGYLGPLARTLAAAVLAVVLVALAFLVHDRDPKNPGAAILAATGIAAAFLSTVSATVVYGWIPAVPGLALGGLIGTAGMLLARQWVNQWVASMAILGALLLAPVVGDFRMLTTATMMLVLTTVGLVLERGMAWKVFPFARTLPTELMMLVTALGDYEGGEAWWNIALGIAFALVHLLPLFTEPRRDPTLQPIDLGLLVASAVPLFLAALVTPNLALGAVGLGLVAIVFGGIGFWPRVAESTRWAVVPLGAIAGTLAVWVALDHRYAAVLLPLVAAAYLTAARATRSPITLTVGAVLGGLGMLSWLGLAVVLVSWSQARQVGLEQVLQSMAMMAVVALGSLAAHRWGVRPDRIVYVSWAGAALTLAVTIVATASWLGTLLGIGRPAFEVGHVVVTVAWIVLCIFFLRRGLVAGPQAGLWLRLALAIAVTAVAKLFLIDLGMLDAPVRVVAFLAVGLLLLLAGTRYARVWERVHGQPDAQPNPQRAATNAAPARPGQRPQEPTWPPPDGPPPGPSVGEHRSQGGPGRWAGS